MPNKIDPETPEAVEGKPPEFSRQIQEEIPFLRRAARRWHRDKANADDLVQDVLVQALANAHLWQPGSDLRAWLYTIMRNRFLAEVNRSGRSASALKEISVAEPASVTNDGRQPDPTKTASFQPRRRSKWTPGWTILDSRGNGEEGTGQITIRGRIPHRSGSTRRSHSRTDRSQGTRPPWHNPRPSQAAEPIRLDHGCSEYGQK